MSFKSKKFSFNVNFKQMFVPKLDDDGEPVVRKNGDRVLAVLKFAFEQLVPVGMTADYTAHWKAEGLNPDTTLQGILNQDEKQSKEGFKSEVRKAVLAVEASIFTPKLTPKQLLTACRQDEAVLKALEDMQANVLANHIGQPRNKDVTKSQAAAVGIALLNSDPDMLKEIAKQLNVKGFGS